MDMALLSSLCFSSPFVCASVDGKDALIRRKPLFCVRYQTENETCALHETTGEHGCVLGPFHDSSRAPAL